MKRISFVLLISLIALSGITQPVPFILKGALKENRQQQYRNIVNYSITKNLSLALTNDTEDSWQDAFWAMELLYYRSAWTDSNIHAAMAQIQDHSTSFQRALLELAFTNYQDLFYEQIRSLMLATKDPKIFSMCAVYILSGKWQSRDMSFLLEKTNERLTKDPENPILIQLQFYIKNEIKNLIKPNIVGLLKKDFLPGNVLLISFQRKNRNYPGLVIVRDTNGNFVRQDGRLFSVPQLARSISNLPGFLTNGNTPEGIFRMDGFDTSKSIFIGPTTNIQLTMPFEKSAVHFYKDSALINKSWDIEQYKDLLPKDLQHYFPLYQSYYAGKAERTEIIAHGTTIDPNWYKNKLYYPLTPTQGCLCTKELWSDDTGRLIESDQQKLAAAVIKAGGPHGYAIVINISDDQKAVDPDEISLYLESINQN